MANIVFIINIVVLIIILVISSSSTTKTIANVNIITQPVQPSSFQVVITVLPAPQSTGCSHSTASPTVNRLWSQYSQPHSHSTDCSHSTASPTLNRL